MSSLCYLCLFAYSDVQHVVLLLVYAFTISVPCCGVRYDVCIKTMFGLLFEGRFMSYLCYLCLFAYGGVKYVLTT